MSSTRRDFLKSLGLVTAGSSLLPLLNEQWIARTEAAVRTRRGMSAKAFARDEDFWYSIRSAYRLSPDFINLESGWFSQQPQDNLAALADHQKTINEKGSFYFRREQSRDRERLRSLLSDYLGCGSEELAILRNTTEALNNVIMGLPMQPGDEALFAEYEYPSMIEQFKMRAERFGTKNVIMKIPLPQTGDRDIVRSYERHITPRTKVILISHMTYLSGQILPVRAVCRMAHSHGIPVIVDAAHSVSHVNYAVPDLEADFYGASLHKWTGAPIGTGILYVKKERIADVWPAFGDVSVAKDNIRKFEHIGTRSCAIEQTIAKAIRFNQALGLERKEARLRYLKQYWADRVKPLPGVYFNTPLETHRSCGLANVGVTGIDPGALVNRLYDDFGIFTVAINEKGITGARIAPNIYTTLTELDAFVAAMEAICRDNASAM